MAVSERGFINVDIQMRSNVPHIFAIGDIVGQPMLAHKAVHEAHVAAEVIAGELQGNKELAAAAFNARVIPSVAYTDPEVAWVGLTEDQAKEQGIKVKKGLFPWAASGRADSVRAARPFFAHIARTLSESPMLALHGLVTHGPHRAKHLHNLHQAQPLCNGVDPGSVAQRWLKRHTRFAHQHRICIGTIECRFSIFIGVIREVH